MSVNKKILSVAIFGALVSGNAFAANLSAPGGAIPAYFAKEIIATPAAPVTLMTSVSANLDWNVGYNFSDGEVRYARVECSNNVKLNPTGVVLSVPGNGNLGAINGVGTNVLTFSITSNAAPTAVSAANTLSVTGNHAITGTGADVTCAVALYDQPSQAQAGGTAGRIAGSVFSGAYLSFAPSYELVNSTPTTNVAEVDVNPAYSAFVPAANVTSAFQPNDLVVVAAADIGVNGYVTYTVRDPDGAGTQTAPYRIDGAAITLADLLSVDTTVTVAGDFTLLGGDVNFTQFGSIFPADSVSASDAVFVVGNTAQNNAFLAMLVKTGEVIQESKYFATLNADPAQPTVYAVSDISNVYLGEIVRNGTQLQAPLAQVPNGWLSRMVLTNTGSTDRPYTIKVSGETGNTITLDAAKLTGTVPANGTTVLDLDTLLKGFTGSPRATLNVTVAGPNNQVQGLYQIVNPTSGSISNHVMVRPGTN